MLAPVFLVVLWVADPHLFSSLQSSESLAPISSLHSPQIMSMQTRQTFHYNAEKDDSTAWSLLTEIIASWRTNLLTLWFYLYAAPQIRYHKSPPKSPIPWLCLDATGHTGMRKFYAAGHWRILGKECMPLLSSQALLTREIILCVAWMPHLSNKKPMAYGLGRK